MDFDSASERLDAQITRQIAINRQILGEDIPQLNPKYSDVLIPERSSPLLWLVRSPEIGI